MDDKIDLLAIHAAGARVSPERSRALPQRSYGDPANSIRFGCEKCAGCMHERIMLAGRDLAVGMCRKKNDDGSKRLYGRRCADYQRKG